ncbi:MAG TPA: autotransporter outer membrane beta-barrel domain-containing protein [Gemmatimonadaceae bacterium]|nr:autotransporter outer membrane beta-barrel domain-containing protein [Gemmatimonadaceae bacterium]
MNRLARLVIVLAAATIHPTVAAAQSLPFRAGQWGAEFQSGDLTTAGVMRFMTPATALVLDVGIIDVGAETNQNVGGDSDKNSLSLLNARLGLRSYRPLANRVAGFWTAGLEVARASEEQTIPGIFGPETVKQTEKHYGVFGQLGADYHVTNNLAVGMAFDVTYARISGKQESTNSNVDITGHRFTATFTPVRVSLFF